MQDAEAKHATTPQNPKKLSSSPNMHTTEGQMQQLSTTAGATTAASLYNKSSVHSKDKKDEPKLSQSDTISKNSQSSKRKAKSLRKMAEKEAKLLDKLEKNSDKRSASQGSSQTSMSSPRKLRDRKTLKKNIVIENSQKNSSDPLLGEEKDDEYHESQDPLAAKKPKKPRKPGSKTPDSKNVTTPIKTQ